MKVVVFTLGCKVNECESDSLISAFIEKGFSVSDKLEKADLYIVNTCAVTADAEKKSRQMVSRIRAISKEAKIIFTGCAAQKNPNDFINKPNVTLVTGTALKGLIPSLIEEKGVKIFDAPKEYEELLPVKPLRLRAYIKVEDGCNNFCSYCIIPYLRGRVRSRNPESVIKEINLSKAKEIVINGINLSAYNYNGLGLDYLMQRLSGVKSRIRLGSLEVRVITKNLLTALKNLKNFAPHFHLSLQAGSNNTLKNMNRKYTTEEFISKVDLIREYFPNAGITTDVIAGFPYETDEDFKKSLEFIKKVAFSDIHPFRFSRREGTVAFSMPDIDQSVKKQRLELLLKLKSKLKTDFINKFIDKELEFLPEEEKDGYIVGYTDNYIRIYLDKKTPLGEIIKVKLIKIFEDGAIATPL